MKKCIKNVNSVAHKLGPALIKATKHKLKVVREEEPKKKDTKIECNIYNNQIAQS